MMNSESAWPLWAAFFSQLHQRGCSVHTQAAYRRDLQQLQRLLPENITPQNITRLHLVAVLKKLSGTRRQPRSLARKLSAWRSYFAFLQAQGCLNHNPCAHLQPPKAPARLPKAVPAEQLNHWLDEPVVSSPLSVRDQAVFELMYGSGLRLSEVVSLNLNQVLLDEGWVHVLGKGQKQRQVPLGRKSIDALCRYLPQRIAADGEEALFTNRSGHRLSGRQIENRLNQWAIQKGCDRHLSPHMFRHSYASHLLQNAHDIRAVQELLGHSSLSTTQQYTRLDFDHLAAAYDDAHPRAKRK